MTPSPPVNRGSPVTPYLNSSTPISFSLYNFHGATMTIKGSLHGSPATVKAFLTLRATYDDHCVIIPTLRQVASWQLFG